MPGRAVMIQFEPGEHIIDSGEGIGDGKAWHVAINETGRCSNRVRRSRKPISCWSPTGAPIRCRLSTCRPRQPATWILRFDYPDTRAQAAASAAPSAGGRGAALGGQPGLTGRSVPHRSRRMGAANAIACVDFRRQYQH